MNAKELGDERAYPLTISRGLTKRELFAAMAMQGILSSPIEMQRAILETIRNHGIDGNSAIVHTATLYADALLAELTKE